MCTSFSIKCRNKYYFFLFIVVLWFPGISIGGDISLGVLPITDLQSGHFLEPQPKTLLTKKDIDKSGAKNLTDILRMIPGLIIDPISGNQSRLNYLGGPSYRSRRLQVLIDGVSYFLPNLARIKLSELPIRLEDIATVEFIHGPSTALYKENAFSGTLSITTVDPRDAKKFSSSISVGSEELQSYHFQWAINESFDNAHNTSINFHSDRGYDESVFSEDAHDSTYAYQGYHRSYFSLDSASELLLTANFFKGNLQREFDNFFQINLPESEVENYVIALDFKTEINNRSLFKVSAYLNSAKREQYLSQAIPTSFFTPEATFLVENYPQLAYEVFVYETRQISDLSSDELALISPALERVAFYGSEITVGSVSNQFSDERTSDIEFTYQYSDSDLSWQSSIGIKHKLIDNPYNYFGERFYLEDYRFVLNGRKIFNNTVSMNLGFLYEDTGLTGDSFSPRMAFVFKVSQDGFVRVSAASAERNPNLYETNHNSRYFLENLEPLFEGQDSILVSTGLKGNKFVESEEIKSYTVSYTKKKNNYLLEARFFYNEYENLISETLSDESFTFSTNRTEAVRKGVGIEYTYDLDQWYIRAGYVYQDSSATRESELELDFSGMGSIHLGYFPVKNWQINLGYAGHNIGFTGSYDEYNWALKYQRKLLSIAYNLTYFPDTVFNRFEEPESGVASDNYQVEYDDSTLHQITIKYQLP